MHSCTQGESKFMPRKRSPSQAQNKLSHQIGQSYVSFGCGEWAALHNVSIVRCILKDAPIVILDEATASVDAANESHIQAAISELVRGKTLLVIAHRLNTIESADQILVVRDGRIAERACTKSSWRQAASIIPWSPSAARSGASGDDFSSNLRNRFSDYRFHTMPLYRMTSQTNPPDSCSTFDADSIAFLR